MAGVNGASGANGAIAGPTVKVEEDVAMDGNVGTVSAPAANGKKRKSETPQPDGGKEPPKKTIKLKFGRGGGGA